MRRRSLALLAVLTAAVILGAGCEKSGAARPTVSTPTVVSSTPAATEASPSAEAVPTAGTPFAGIVVMRCTNEPKYELTAYDPATSQATGTRTFAYGGTGILSCNGSQDGFRGKFNTDFTRMVRSIPGADDGGTHVGFVGADSDQVTDLTPPKSDGYGAVTPQQTQPTFNPVTGRIWFYDAAAKHYASVDPDAPADAPKVESPSMLDASTNVFFVGRDGKSVINWDAYRKLSPDGKSVVYNETGMGFRVASASVSEPAGKLLALSPNAPAPGCAPTQFIDATSFLCVGNGTTGNPNGLFKMTINPAQTQVTQLALLPASDREILGQVVSPDRTQVAFISQDRATGEFGLYTASLAGGSEPVKVAQLASSPYERELQLLDWK